MLAERREERQRPSLDLGLSEYRIRGGLLEYVLLKANLGQLGNNRRQVGRESVSSPDRNRRRPNRLKNRRSVRVKVMQISIRCTCKGLDMQEGS
jgi:hypothetical protein